MLCGLKHVCVCGPAENLRRTDERIEEARCYRKQVIAKILDIPSNENDVVREVSNAI